MEMKDLRKQVAELPTVQSNVPVYAQFSSGGELMPVVQVTSPEGHPHVIIRLQQAAPTILEA